MLDQLTLFDLEQAGSKALNEIAIMHHCEDAAIEVGQRLLETLPRGDIQMVYWLVQQQEIAALHYNAGQ